MDQLVEFDLEAERLAAGLSVTDLVRLTGRDRRTIWRYRKSGRCPVFVQTIIEQQRRIRHLAAALVG